MTELAFAGTGAQGAHTLNQGVTEYFAVNGRFTAATSQALCSIPWRAGSATAKKFYARVTTNNASAGGTFGLAINGGSSVSVAVTASTTGTFSDTSSTLSLSNGDAIAFTATTTAGTGAITYSGISCAIQVTGQAAVVQGTTVANLTTTLGAVSRFFNFPVGTSISATESIFAQTLFDASVLSNLRINVSVNQRGANSTAKVRLNGADTSVSVTIPTTTTGVFEDTSNSATGAATDIFNGVFTTGGVSNAQTLTINQASLLVTGGSARHTSVFLGVRNTTAQSMTAGATRYHSIVGDIDNNAAPTAAETACPIPFDGSVFAFGVNVSANTATTNGTLTLFKNASATAAVVTVTSATTGWFTNTSPSVSFVEGDRLGHQWINGATNPTSLVGVTTTLTAAATAFEEAVSESASAADTPSATTTYPRTVDESASAADAVNVVGDLAVEVSESAGAADSVDVGGTFNVAVSEAASAADTVTLEGFIISVVLSESAAAQDTIIFLSPFHEYIEESAEAEDEVEASRVRRIWFLSFADVTPPPQNQGPGNPGKLKGDYREEID